MRSGSTRSARPGGRGALCSAAVLLALALALTGAGPPAAGRGPGRPPSLTPPLPAGRVARSLPPIVFASRHPLPGVPRAVPGLGPHHRAAAPGGRLWVREPDGRLRELVPGHALFDVADPAVAFDGRRVAFAGTPHPDSGWRLYVVSLDGGGARPVTRTDPRRPQRHDDLDPCWIAEHRLCFASTRFPLTAQYAEVPATNLWVVDVPRPGQEPKPPWRITSERNGAEEPTLDPIRGEIVFARWWFNRFRATGTGIAAARPETRGGDSVNLWHAVALGEQGLRLAAGGLGSRRAMMGYQPAFLRDGTPVGVVASNLGLSPWPGALAVQRFRGRFGRAERVAGAALPDSAGHAYSEALGLAAPSACAPTGLPDGRILFSYDPGARGDFGLYLVDAGGETAPRLLVDLPGTLELDAVPAVRRRPARLPEQPRALPASDPATLGDLGARGTFTYRSLDLFHGARPAASAPPRTPGARIRFYAAPLLGPGAGDTALLLRESPVGPDGSVEERGLPADVPLFEQVVDAQGRVLRSAHGPAHVAGFNSGIPGRESRCLGCHVGHSAIPVPARRGGGR